MSTTIDKPHLLIIEETPATEEFDAEKTYRIVHPPTCPWESWSHYHGAWCEEGACDRKRDFHRHCLTQWETENVGLDSLEIYSVEGTDHIDPNYVPASRWEPEWHKLKPGKYLVQMTYTWTGSWYDEPDSEFWIEAVVAW